MSAHTPGPWQVEERGGYTLICCADSRRLAQLAAAREIRANARLIAAAPELLAALRDMLEGTQEDCGSIRMPSAAAVRAAFAAIAKAEGKAC